MENSKHSKPDRYWDRKWSIVRGCTIFAAIIVLAALVAAFLCSSAVAGNVYSVMSFAVPSFLVPLLAYFGVSEWNNQTVMKLDKEEK